MAKLQDAIDALAKVDATKGLAETLRAELGALAGADSKDVASRLKMAETRVAELTNSVKDLDDKAKGAEALKAKVATYEGEKRTAIVAKAFAEKAKEAGIAAGAIATAQRLVKLDALQVDLEKGTVAGLTKEVFDGLKASDPILFQPAAAASGIPGATVPPIPPAASGAPAAAFEVPGPIGFFAKRS